MIPRWQICPDCGTLVIDGECWCTIGHRLNDEDIEVENKKEAIEDEYGD
jgi:hypothetical protein